METNVINKTRNLIVAASRGYTARTETHEGREHLVVPVVGLVEGVVFAMNAKNGAEFVPAAVYQDAPERWEGKPIFEGHPLVDGKPVRGDNKFWKDQRAVGLVRNASVTDTLNMEAWLDVERATKRSPALLARARAGEPIEISVGVLVASDQSEGTHKGKAYSGVWEAYDPDHLALLPEGILGACSLEMGCGVRAMQEFQTADAADDLYVLWPDPTGEDDHGREAADKASKAADRRTGKAKDEVTHHAAQMSHEAAANMHESVVKEMVGYAHPAEGTPAHAHLEKANAHRAQAAAHLHSRNALGRRTINGYQKRVDMKAAEKFVAFMDTVKKFFADESVEGDEPKTLEKNLGEQGNPDVSTIQPTEEIDMTKEQIVKFLESATPCQMTALGAFVEGGAKPAVAEVAAVVVKPEPTEAELKALADARAKEIAEAVDAGIKADRTQQAATTAKAKTIATLSAIKNQPFTPEQLAAKTQAELDALVAFGEKVAPKEVRAAVDFGGQGAPKTETTDKQEVPDPPSLETRLLERNKKS